MTATVKNFIPSNKTPALQIVVNQDTIPVQFKPSLLTHLCFEDKKIDDLEECLTIKTSLEALGSNIFSQLWFCENNVVLDRYKNVQFSKSKNMLFGHIYLLPVQENNFKQLCEQAYTEIFECLQHSGCVHLLRTWNFFPGITNYSSEDQNANRYDIFCQSRLHAMQASKINNEIYPAATVIGNHVNCLQIYFLASDTPGIAVENPRQTSAYKYPVSVEQSQPLFSRGLLKTWGDKIHFYVSGTASIVGYKTLHINDVSAQLNEAINNVETLITHANNQHNTQLNAQDDLLYMKIYIRRKEDVSKINKVLAARLSDDTPRILLLGDMCREDLLVEIEAFYQT